MREGTHPYDAWDNVEPTKAGFSNVFAGMSNPDIATWLKAKGVLVGRDNHGGGYSALTYQGTAGYNEFYSMMRGDLPDVDHMLTQIKVQTFIEVVLTANHFSNRYWYVTGRSCPVYYKKLFKINYSGSSGFDPSILETSRPDSVKQLLNKPSIRNGVVVWKQSLQSYDTVQIEEDHAPSSASNRGYTVGFTFGVNGFVPIQTPEQGSYSSIEMFETWADISQSFNTNSTLDLNGLKGQELISKKRATDTDQGTDVKKISAFLKQNRNLRLPTDAEYAEVVEVPSRGDIIITNLLNTYKVLNVVGNPYSSDGFYVDVEGY